MKITLHYRPKDRALIRRIADRQEVTLSEVFRKALAVYELLQGADKVTVTHDGETETLIMP